MARAAIANNPTVEQLTGPTVVVHGEVIPIGPLSLDQWVGISHVALRAISRGNFKREDAETTSLEAFIPMLDADTIAELYGVLLSRPAQWARDHFDMVEFLTVLDAVGEKTQLRDISAAFRRVVKRW